VGRPAPPSLVTTAISETGIPALVDAVDAHREQARSPEMARQRAVNQLHRALAVLAAQQAEAKRAWSTTVEAVAARELDPLTAAERLLNGP
jgi:putative protein kinase ArgK-like GTPase of G3E family